MIKAILYDLDGVLVDAVDIHKTAFNDALKKIANFQLSDEEHSKDFNGLPTKKKLEMLVGQKRLDEKQAVEIEKLKQVFTKRLIKDKLDIDFEKIKLHSWARGCGLKIACVTNSIRETAELMLKRTGQLDYMDDIITNEDVVNAKPSPEPYLRAMIHLGIGRLEGLAIEDSDKGYASAFSTRYLLAIRVFSPKEVTIERISQQIISMQSLHQCPID